MFDPPPLGNLRGNGCFRYTAPMKRAECVSSGKDWIACRGCSSAESSLSARNRSLRVVLLFDAQFSLSEYSLRHATDRISFWQQQLLPKRRKRAVFNKINPASFIFEKNG
jgi:hypothetical protein